MKGISMSAQTVVVIAIAVPFVALVAAAAWSMMDINTNWCTWPMMSIVQDIGVEVC